MLQKRSVAVILAAGNGTRTEFAMPKQLVKLCGQPVVAHTIGRFQECALIDEIAIVASAASKSDIEAIVARQGFSKVTRILLGGEERHESSLAAIDAYRADAARYDLRLIFHDAVRPLVSDRIIVDVVEALDRYRAVDVTVPATDTVVMTDADAQVLRGIPDRRLLHLGQTPQGFAYDTICTAYESARRDPGFRTTDDCGVVLKYLPQETIGLVRGAANNLKLTYADDLLVLDKYMQSNAGRRATVTHAGEALAGLQGRSIVVFGGTSGIGEAVARIAREHGARVYATGRSRGVDIANAAAVRDFLDVAAAESGGIDAVLNTAAVLNRQPLMHMSDEAIQQGIQTNFLGAIHVARAAFAHLRRSAGQLVLFASSSYTYGRAQYSLYSASKAAVVNLTQALADEWAEFGVRVNCVCPERTRTPMRVRSFGIEPAESLLDADDVARSTLGLVTSTSTGFVYDIKLAQGRTGKHRRG
jgi:2-C-methyl-D-erythritol 4-phosphate cytidylyltransferase